jgi:hypothetical protein
VVSHWVHWEEFGELADKKLVAPHWNVLIDAVLKQGSMCAWVNDSSSKATQIVNGDIYDILRVKSSPVKSLILLSFVVSSAS